MFKNLFHRKSDKLSNQEKIDELLHQIENSISKCKNDIAQCKKEEED